jgi:hypothetical protein
MLEDNELKKTIRAFLMGSSGRLEMKPLDLDENFALKHDFESKSGEDFKDFRKAKMKKELGLKNGTSFRIENPTDAQLEEIIQRKGQLQRKSKGKTVFLGDFIDEIHSDGSELSDIDDILDAEILDEPIRIKLDDEL